MPKAGSPLAKWRVALFLLGAALVTLADQLSKEWVRSYPPGDTIARLGFLRLVHVSNTGGVFGLFQGQSFALTIVAFIGIAVVLALVFFAERHLPYLIGLPGATALGLVLGGTMGNLIDRLRFGSVTDFIDFVVWPAFNVADSAVVVGTALMAFHLLRLAIAERRRSAG
jgi:signal peptidase II